MPKASNDDRQIFDKTAVTLVAAGFAAVALAALIVKATPSEVPESLLQRQAAETRANQPRVQISQAQAVTWATTAPGRVEPKGGRISVRPEASGRIVSVHADAADEVKTGDLLVRLRDDEARARVRQAEAEVAVRLGERNEEPEENKLVTERRAAADALAAAQRALHQATMGLDKAYLDHKAGRGDAADLEAARKALREAEKNVEQKADALTLVRSKAEMPAPTRLDSGLTLARADLRLAEIALENTRVRAPVDGTVLNFNAHVGEIASSSARQPIVVLGDMSSIEVTAEVQERDVSKVRVGQDVIVRSPAFEDAEFTGKVTEIAPAVGTPGLRAQGPRQQLDAEVLEVKIELEGTPPVMPGMRVDVFFKAEKRVSNATTKLG